MRKRWVRRLVYLIILVIWLPVMVFPFVAFSLATNGELQIGDESHLRFFMVQGAEENGVGIQWKRSLFQPDHCQRNTVVFLMWEGEGENSSFCQCIDPETNESLPVGSSCALPRS